MATGVLVLGVDRATRLLGHLMLTEKAYDATVRLGVATSTDDAEGEVVATASTSALDESAVRAAAAAFVGTLEQVPSAVSAVKVDGKRAYARVRAGEEVVLEPRTVTVHELVVGDVRLGDDVADLDLSVRCTSGTYIRAIARDLGAALGVGGHLTALRRTAVGAFTLDQARTLDQLAGDFETVSLDDAARASFVTLDLTGEQSTDVRFGRTLDLELPGLTAVFDPSGAFLALYEPRGGQARAVAVFV
jgi:tRNA pseudouridine55 synthase